MQNGAVDIESQTPCPVGRPSLDNQKTNPEHPQVTRQINDNEDRPRWILHLQAQFWRVLMGIGMLLHRLAPPQTPSPAFSRTISSALSPPGEIKLFFYVPDDYRVQTRLRRKRYPVVVNFHGGGFTLGHPTDDARWCQALVGRVGAVVVSVGYRLAPEHCFPVPVEDGAAAVRWCVENAEELLLDPERFTLSGFSSGANMCFTVAYRLTQETVLIRSKQTPVNHETDLPPQASTSSDSSASSSPNPTPRTRRLSAALRPRSKSKSAAVDVSESREFRLRSLASFYPPCNYTLSRAERREHCIRPDQALPPIFTSLFDESYLQPPSLDLSNPLLSPGLAPKSWMEKLPHDIVLVTCEWDMLLREGEVMREKLQQAGKNVWYKMVDGVPHAWDKAPNPMKRPPGAWEVYLDVAGELRRVLRGERHEEIIEENGVGSDEREGKSGVKRVEDSRGNSDGERNETGGTEKIKKNEEIGGEENKKQHIEI